MTIPFKKLTLALAISSLSIALAAEASQRSARIIGGSEASPDSYPWMTSLQSSSGEHICGASLISPQWVATAAHCIEDAVASDLQVVIGDYNLQSKDTGEVKRSVKRVIAHPDYNEDHDIAILELSEAVDKAPVEMISLAQLKSLTAGTSLTVMGWGNRATEGEDFPDKLHEVNVPLVSTEQCKQNYSSVGVDITDNMICAGFAEGGKDSCQGDSGGPLLIQQDSKWLQLGVVSFGEGCAAPNYPGVYTNIANYGEWIKTAKASQPGKPDQGGDNGEYDAGDEGFPSDDVTILGLPDFVLFEVPLEAQAEAEGALTEKLTVMNDTDAALSITGITLENEDVFSIAENHCEGKTLDQNESCDITVSFQLPDGYSLEDMDDMDDMDDWDEFDDESDHQDGDELLAEGEYEYEYEYEEDEYEEDDELGLGDEYALEDENEREEGNELEDDEWDIAHLDGMAAVEGALIVATDNELVPEVDVYLLGLVQEEVRPFDLPDAVEFLAVENDEVVEESVTLYNDTEQALTITDVAINDATDFEVIKDACTAQVIEPEGECEITMAYTAQTEAPQEALLTITTNDASKPKVLVDLYGEMLQELDVGDGALLDWYFSGETPWGISNEEAFELVTDLLDGNTDSLLATEVEGPAELAFDFELDGDSNNNHFYFVVDGEVVKTISGKQTGAVHHTAQLTEGKHQVEWIYRKQDGSNTGATARVSNVKVNGAATKDVASKDASSSAEVSGGSAGIWLMLMAGLLSVFRLGGSKKS
jgi:V8-like Glu-specific endopeptidase